jgi:hypothetical protein
VSGEYEHSSSKIMAPSNDPKKQNYDFAQNGCYQINYILVIHRDNPPE